VSLGVLLVALVHTILHWDWTTDTLRRFAGRLSVASRWNLVIDVVLFVALMVCMVSGIMVSRHVLIAFGLFAPGYFVWNPLHSISATVVLALVLVHLAMHWKWIAVAMRSRVIDPIRGRVGTDAGEPSEDTAREAS
ncbi:MAG: DUF4405 domain-containing protein, partial [Coriobacteriia bacterium]|nr:DUF4405 domain-containing protein [Coriobacteriia bacterium]